MHAIQVLRGRMQRVVCLKRLYKAQDALPVIFLPALPPSVPGWACATDTQHARMLLKWGEGHDGFS